MWKFYALLSALFAALTAICAKIGVKEPVNTKVVIGALLITAGSIVMMWK